MACSSALRPGSVAAALAVAALFFAFGAWAQTTTSSITVSPAQFGLQDCNHRKQIAVTWTFASTPTSSTIGAILSTDSACGAGKGTPQALSPPQGQSGTLTLEPGAFLYNVKANGCVADVKSSQPATIYVCVRYPATGTATEQLIKPVTFALTPPTAPASLSARAGDTHVKLSWAQATRPTRSRPTTSSRGSRARCPRAPTPASPTAAPRERPPSRA